MKFLHVLKHIAVIAAGVIVLIGVPLLCTGYLTSLITGNTDVISSASVVLDAPSGDFVILINKDFHDDTEALDDWTRFFSGSYSEDELLIIFEDISCSVARTDAPGAEMAESFRSKLPENQMLVKREDVTLLCSRADHGLFDMILMSREFADQYHVETAVTDNVQLIEVSSSER